MKEWLLKQLKILKDFRNETTDFTGAILPTPEQLAEMPKLMGELVASANPVIWKPLDISKIPKYPVYSQNGSSSCVAMSVCLIASILYYLRTNVAIQFSPSWVYQQRVNKPDGGMIGTDAFKIASRGLLPEVLMLSMDLGETQINAVPTYPWYQKVADVFSFEDTLVQLPTNDLETVASVMQTTGKPVNVWYEFTRSEWDSIPKIIISDTTEKLRHSVVALAYGIYEGEKSIVIQESWGFGSTQFGVFRIIKQSFHNSRNLFSAYPRRFRFETTEDKPKYDGTIISFQKCMKALGFFPDGVPFVESFGPLSRSACFKFQAKYGLSQSGTINLQTKNKLVELFP